mmetsp:Transcript_8618/g.16314  ORF Transcript_8618/g.16314 Transcript_8618/m.16314 type:complete len:1281 (-) Transcript_8618:121-3963(-)
MDRSGLPFGEPVAAEDKKSDPTAGSDTVPGAFAAFGLPSSGIPDDFRLSGGSSRSRSQRSRDEEFLNDAYWTSGAGQNGMAPSTTSQLSPQFQLPTRYPDYPEDAFRMQRSRSQSKEEQLATRTRNSSGNINPSRGAGDMLAPPIETMMAGAEMTSGSLTAMETSLPGVESTPKRLGPSDSPPITPMMTTSSVPAPSPPHDVELPAARSTSTTVWPFQFETIAQEDSYDWGETTLAILGVPDKNLGIRGSHNAKKPTCLRLLWQSSNPKQCVERFVPLKFTSRVRNSQSRGMPSECVRYHFRDGFKLAVGGHGSRIQIVQSTGGSVPQAFLVSKYGTFGLRCNPPPTKALYTVYDDRSLRMCTPTVDISMAIQKEDFKNSQEKKLTISFDIGIPLKRLNNHSQDVLPFFLGLPDMRKKFEASYPGCALHDRMPEFKRAPKRAVTTNIQTMQWIVEFNFRMSDITKTNITKLQQISKTALSSILPMEQFQLRGIFPGSILVHYIIHADADTSALKEEGIAEKLFGKYLKDGDIPEIPEVDIREEPVDDDPEGGIVPWQLVVSFPEENPDKKKGDLGRECAKAFQFLNSMGKVGSDNIFGGGLKPYGMLTTPNLFYGLANHHEHTFVKPLAEIFGMVISGGKRVSLSSHPSTSTTNHSIRSPIRGHLPKNIQKIARPKPKIIPVERETTLASFGSNTEPPTPGTGFPSRQTSTHDIPRMPPRTLSERHISRETTLTQGSQRHTSRDTTVTQETYGANVLNRGSQAPTPVLTRATSQKTVVDEPQQLGVLPEKKNPLGPVGLGPVAEEAGRQRSTKEQPKEKKEDRLVPADKQGTGGQGGGEGGISSTKKTLQPRRNATAGMMPEESARAAHARANLGRQGAAAAAACAAVPLLFGTQKSEEEFRRSSEQGTVNFIRIIFEYWCFDVAMPFKLPTDLKLLYPEPEIHAKAEGTSRPTLRPKTSGTRMDRVASDSTNTNLTNMSSPPRAFTEAERLQFKSHSTRTQLSQISQWPSSASVTTDRKLHSMASFSKDSFLKGSRSITRTPSTVNPQPSERDLAEEKGLPPNIRVLFDKSAKERTDTDVRLIREQLKSMGCFDTANGSLGDDTCDWICRHTTRSVHPRHSSPSFHASGDPCRDPLSNPARLIIVIRGMVKVRSTTMGDTKAMDYGRGSTFMLGPNFRNIQVIEESELLIGWLDSTLTEEGRIIRQFSAKSRRNSHSSLSRRGERSVNSRPAGSRGALRTAQSSESKKRQSFLRSLFSCCTMHTRDEEIDPAHAPEPRR